MNLTPSSSVVLRHRRENLKKCSLRGLEKRNDVIFYNYPLKETLDFSHHIYLTFDAPPLTKEDRDYPLLILDATWRLAGKMEKTLDILKQNVIPRSLPSHFRTAYPRKQEDCLDPQRGLASIEALFIAYHILGKKTDGLLDDYYWKEEFLSLNSLYLPHFMKSDRHNLS